MEELGRRIRERRLARGLTLAAVAGDALSVALVSKIERGLVTPSLQTLSLVAGRLGVPPGALLSDDRPDSAAAHHSRIALARARLLLGDPAGALTTVTGGAGTPGEPRDGAVGSAAAEGAPVTPAPLGARAAALRAEAALTLGQTHASVVALSGTTSWLERARSAASDVPDSEAAAARAEVAWVVGLQQRRRGDFGGAEASWHGCLGVLESVRSPHPWWLLLRATVLGELGALREASGDAALARNLVARAATIAAGVAHGETLAATLVASATEALGMPAEPPGGMGSPAAPGYASVALIDDIAAVALTLATLAAADRLMRRLAHDAARLERVPQRGAPNTPGAPIVPDVPHSRHLE